MSLPLFLVVVGVIVIANVLLSGMGLWLAGRVFKAKRFTLVRAEIAAVLLAAIGVAATALALGAHSDVFVFAVCVASLLVQTLIVKSLCGERWPRSIGLWVLAIVFSTPLSLGVAMGLKATILDSYVMSSNSMAPTLSNEDRFLVDRTLKPERWDVAVFRPPFDPRSVFAMRVVGLPGEFVEIKDGEITIDGRVATKPPHLSQIRYVGDRPVRETCNGCTGSPMLLGPNEFYVLGDNSPMSNDSRYWQKPDTGRAQAGAVVRSDIVGTVRFVYSPMSRIRVLR
jgi:signal peptidase I